ncbi:MAG: Outer rane autotransporter barrel [Devosia sp.]|uniref:Ig-like domain repeat protein n=1 Tax=Devosia sp. TaxID=1871048 RepID=UPI0026325EA8|nr:Ig-like domain repeat protein [Devosia sp.]MDB5542610.1 Outer rane autotransporter barrel [Devosia sp.]
MFWYSGSDDVSSSNSTVTLSAIAPASTTTLSITPNPVAPGEEVTLVATVAATAGEVTGGLGVTFFDGSVLLDTVEVVDGPLSGTATLTTSFSTAGPHIITAAFNGTTSVGASSIEGTADVVEVSLDSANLRATQISASRLEALNSGRAFVDAIQASIHGGFNAGHQLTLGANSVQMSYVPEAVDDVAWPDGTVPAGNTQIWANLSGAGVGGWGNGDADTISGLQINALAGISYKLTPELLVGVVGGYEAFHYNSTTMDSTLSGDGWTLGGYVGGNIADDIKVFAALGYSGLGYDGTAGAATGSFDAWRVTASAGIGGAVDTYGFTIEPSLNIFALCEGQQGYTDSLATTQAARDFMTGQASAVVKLLYPLAAEGMDMLPYAGLYADYTVEGDSEDLPALGLGGLVTGLDGGVSGRIIGGVGASFDGGAKFDFGAQLGGIGADLRTYRFTGAFSLPL